MTPANFTKFALVILKISKMKESYEKYLVQGYLNTAAIYN
jgi:hypothetical protein